MRCELLTWEACYELARKLAWMLREDQFQPDVIVAIARGGYFAARVLSDHLGVFDLDSIRIEHYQGTSKGPAARVRYPLSAAIGGKRLLLVDDVSDSGDTFAVAIAHLREHGEPLQLRTAVMHHKSSSAYAPDYRAAELGEWRWLIYPWAAIEDLSGLLHAMEPPPRSVQEFAETLQQRHGVVVPPQMLEDVVALNPGRLK
jgi:uncharacterized protein